MRKIYLSILLGCIQMSLFSQETFPVNGVGDKRETVFAFVHATIIKDPTTTINNATLVIKNGKIISIGAALAAPTDAITIDCSGKFIYPSFIDLYADYGIANVQTAGAGRNPFTQAQLASNQKGAFGWNQAIKADVDAASLFVTDDAKAKTLRELGFGSVLTHQKDGIARGTGVLVSLASIKENLSILKDRKSVV